MPHDTTQQLFEYPPCPPPPLQGSCVASKHQDAPPPPAHFHKHALGGKVTWVPLDYKQQKLLPKPPQYICGNFPSYFVAGLPNRFAPASIMILYDHLRVSNPSLQLPLLRLYSKGMHRTPSGQLRTTCHVFAEAFAQGNSSSDAILSLNYRVLWDVEGAWLATSNEEMSVLVRYAAAPDGSNNSVFDDAAQHLLYRHGCPVSLMRLAEPNEQPAGNGIAAWLAGATSSRNESQCTPHPSNNNKSYSRVDEEPTRTSECAAAEWSALLHPNAPIHSKTLAELLSAFDSNSWCSGAQL